MDWGLKKVEVINLSQRTQWYSLVRLFFLLAVSIPGIVSLYTFEGFSKQVRLDLALAVVALASNLLFYGLTHLSQNMRYQAYLASIWIMLDIILISTLIFTNGGIESRSPILYSVPILIAAALFGRRAIYTIAALCAVLYTGMIVADYTNVIHSVGAFDPTLRLDTAYVITTICFFPAVLLVIALGVDFITSLLLEKQQELSESLIALENAQEIAKLGSWEWDIEKDEIVWSKELYRIYGRKPTKETIRFESYLDLLQSESANSQRQVVLNALEKKKGFQSDHQIELPNGAVRYIHGEGRPVRDVHGRIIKMAGTSQDVTNIFHLDQAKREFVSLASHQLRTPASAVKAFLSLLIEGQAGKLSKQQALFARQAYTSNNRQLEIIDNLLSLASIESGKLTVQKELINLAAILKNCMPAHIQKAKDKKQKISISNTRQQIDLRADPSLLKMAIDNLLSNAIKYSPEHTKITISSRATRVAAYIDIQDEGIGISKKDLELLFQKFSRINNPESKTVEGSGLGLYMTKHIIELHGGKISVRSRRGQGTRFTIKLPLFE